MGVIIDFFLFGGLVVSAYLGYRGGVTKKLVTLLSLIGAVVLASVLMNPLGGVFVDILFLSETLSYVVAFLFVIVVVMVAAIYVFRRFGENSMVKSTSQIMGGSLGLFEGAMIISLLLLMFKVFDVPGSSGRRDSMLYKPLVQFAPATFEVLRPYLPGAASFRDELSKTFKDQEIFETISEPVKSL